MQGLDILAILWASVGWLVPVVLIVTGLRLGFKARVQGWLGEYFVAARLEKHAHTALHDVILPDGRGGLTQVDHLLLSDQGIWVVETKAWSGQIYGREREWQWTQRLGHKSFRIANPLRQNYGHIKAVEAVVGQAVPIHGHVIMAGTATFPKGMPSGVSTSREFRRKLATTRTGQQLPADWTRAWRELEAHTKIDAETCKTHRRQLERVHGRDMRPAFGTVLLGIGLLLAVWMALV